MCLVRAIVKKYLMKIKEDFFRVYGFINSRKLTKSNYPVKPCTAVSMNFCRLPLFRYSYVNSEEVLKSRSSFIAKFRTSISRQVRKINGDSSIKLSIMYLNSSYPYLFPNTSKRVLHVFPCKIPMVLTGEFVHQSRGFFPDGDHFLYSFELNVLLSSFDASNSWVKRFLWLIKPIV